MMLVRVTASGSRPLRLPDEFRRVGGSVLPMEGDLLKNTMVVIPSSVEDQGGPERCERQPDHGGTGVARPRGMHSRSNAGVQRFASAACSSRSEERICPVAMLGRMMPKSLSGEFFNLNRAFVSYGELTPV